jgi:hypothetical protein
MKLSTLSLALALTLESVSSFCLVPSKVSTPTFLRYTIIGNPDDDVTDSRKSDSSSPVAQATAATDQFGGPSSLAGYSDYDEQSAVDELNVDAYDNAAGGIVPGFQLSSLCSDD